MFFADSKLSMGIALKIANQSGETNPMTAESDYSIYTLQQLLKARHWFDADHTPTGRGGSKKRSKSVARVFKNQPSARDLLPLARVAGIGLTVSC